ncbi:MAG: SHOCT domain-containing protein [Ferruginibacter sp.]|nr:SHOCT domain-containing protein [Ferruginibacter sp.]MBU9936629.1 SHOCT domain-containing protein [Ferruginibacter sp.]
MKELIFILLLCPVISTAQTSLPRFENDTLYTSGGYSIYKGQVLHLASGTSEAGYFRYLKFHYSMSRNDTYILQNSSILVDKLRNYKNSGAGNYSIRISGTATRKDNSKMEVDFILEFENAIAGFNGSAGELTIPEAFRKKRAETIAMEPEKQTTPVETKKQTVPDEMKKLLIADEIKKLFDLYKAGALTKEEYEARKKKLLEQ